MESFNSDKNGSNNYFKKEVKKPNHSITGITEGAHGGSNFTSTAEIMEDAKERTHDTSQTAVKMKLGVRGWGSGAGPV